MKFFENVSIRRRLNREIVDFEDIVSPFLNISNMFGGFCCSSLVPMGFYDLSFPV
jgi:hypothetical protein